MIVLIRSQIYGKIYGISLTYINIEAHYQRGEAEERGELHMSQQEFDTKVNFQILDLFGCCP